MSNHQWKWNVAYYVHTLSIPGCSRKILTYIILDSLQRLGLSRYSSYRWWTVYFVNGQMEFSFFTRNPIYHTIAAFPIPNQIKTEIALLCWIIFIGIVEPIIWKQLALCTYCTQLQCVCMYISLGISVIMKLRWKCNLVFVCCLTIWSYDKLLFIHMSNIDEKLMKNICIKNRLVLFPFYIDL